MSAYTPTRGSTEGPDPWLYAGWRADLSEPEATYAVLRFYANPHPAEPLATGLTLAEAQEWCRDPESSSQTATTAAGLTRTAELGDWFEGYQVEETS